MMCTNKNTPGKISSEENIFAQQLYRHFSTLFESSGFGIIKNNLSNGHPIL